MAAAMSKLAATKAADQVFIGVCLEWRFCAEVAQRIIASFRALAAHCYSFSF